FRCDPAISVAECDQACHLAFPPGQQLECTRCRRDDLGRGTIHGVVDGVVEAQRGTGLETGTELPLAESCLDVCADLSPGEVSYRVPEALRTSLTDRRRRSHETRRPLAVALGRGH